MSTIKNSHQYHTRQKGIYYTTLFNPFSYNAFTHWIATHNLTDETVLEPFAGCNNIIHMLQGLGLAKTFQSYDLCPQSREVQQRDTLTDYPQGYKVCITNPPWLYKSSAHRRGLNFPDTPYNDLYKLSLSIALEHTEYVGALLPASFIQSKIFHDRLERIIFLNRPLFTHTESPVCLALFTGKKTKDFEVYDDDSPIGTYTNLQKYLPPTSKLGIRFNIPDGELGFIAIDNHREPSISFCYGDELSAYKIRQSSRSITRIGGVRTTASLIQALNTYIASLREKTRDIFLTTFKGLRKDGKYRRRMDYQLTRDIIKHVTS